MDKELLLQKLGGHNKHKQWYEIYPERLEEEIRLVKKHCPGFVFSGNEHKGNVYWTGKARCLLNSGKELSSLQIKIECECNYPIVFPKVYDLKKVLVRKKCPHLNAKDKSICYGNRLGPDLDFTKNTRIKDVVRHVAIFLAYQWYFEKNKEWPRAQLHGEYAFLEQEIKRGTIPPFELCPCGMTVLKYKDCHLPKVKKLLKRDEAKYANKLRHIKINIGRNDKCPCGSGRKSKRCCFASLNFKDSKIFLLMKYPKLAERSNFRS